MAERDHLPFARLDAEPRPERPRQRARPRAGGEQHRVGFVALAVHDDAARVPVLHDHARHRGARHQRHPGADGGLRIRHHEPLVVHPVVAVHEHRAAHVRRQRRLAAAHVPRVPRFDAELARPFVAGADLGGAHVLGGRERIDGAARDVLHVDAGALAQVAHHVGVAAPALDRERGEGGLRGIAERRQEARGRARGFRAGRRALEKGHRAAGLRELERRSAADDPSADDNYFQCVGAWRGWAGINNAWLRKPSTFFACDLSTFFAGDLSTFFVYGLSCFCVIASAREISASLRRDRPLPGSTRSRPRPPRRRGEPPRRDPA